MNINNMLKYSSKIGLFIEDKDKNILVKREKLKKIGKVIYNVPVFDVNEEELDVNNLLEKTFKSVKIKSFINEVKYLDELCNEKKQTNIYCELNEDADIDPNEYKWISLDELNVKIEVPKYITTAVAIYQYNDGR